VITVGAVEQFRDITNDVWKCTRNGTGTNASETCATNKPWRPLTDSSDQVAPFSGRGNVAWGVRERSVRFKPDVVAPGTFVVSTRSGQWDERAYYNPTSHIFGSFRGQEVTTNDLWVNVLFIPDTAVQADIDIQATAGERLPIFMNESDFPTSKPGGYDFVRTNHVSMPPDNGPTLVPTGVNWYYGVGNPGRRRRRSMYLPT
jgi:hypothetical protein